MKDIIIMCQTGITASCSHFNNLFWMTFKLNCILIQIQRRKPTSLTSFANQPVNTVIIKNFKKAELPPCNSYTLSQTQRHFIQLSPCDLSLKVHSQQC